MPNQIETRSKSKRTNSTLPESKATEIDYQSKSSKKKKYIWNFSSQPPSIKDMFLLMFKKLLNVAVEQSFYHRRKFWIVTSNWTKPYYSPKMGGPMISSSIEKKKKNPNSRAKVKHVLLAKWNFLGIHLYDKSGIKKGCRVALISTCVRWGSKKCRI